MAPITKNSITIHYNKGDDTHRKKNQRLLSLYEKMYDDLKSQSEPSEKEKLVTMLLDNLGNHVLPKSSRKSIEEALQCAISSPSKILDQ